MSGELLSQPAETIEGICDTLGITPLQLSELTSVPLEDFNSWQSPGHHDLEKSRLASKLDQIAQFTHWFTTIIIPESRTKILYERAVPLLGKMGYMQSLLAGTPPSYLTDTIRHGVGGSPIYAERPTLDGWKTPPLS